MTRISILVGLLPFYLASCVYMPALFNSPLRTPDDGEVEIAFETLILEEWSPGEPGVERYLETEPYLILLTAASEADALSNWVNSQQLEQVRQVDFTHQAVLALFRGLQPSLKRHVVIERVVCVDNTLRVDAQFWAPGPDEEAQSAESSPYHIVRLPKIGCVSTFSSLELRSGPIP